MSPVLGMDVVTSEWLTETKVTKVARTWCERLWSWPWRPWVAMKTTAIQVPSSQVFQLAGGKLLCHPVMLDRIWALQEDRCGEYRRFKVPERGE